MQTNVILQAVEQDIATFKTRARHLVYVSTDFVYDPAHRQFPQREEAGHYAAEGAAEGYGGKKRQGEVVLARCYNSSSAVILCSNPSWPAIIGHSDRF